MNDSTSDSAVLADFVVKPVGRDRLERAIDIWSMAFGFMDRDRWATFFDTMLDEIYGVYDRDNLVAISGIAHFQMWFADRLIPCGGISAVAADPAYRRRGLIRICLKKCLEALAEKRVPISSLWPFSYPFYRKMGWAVTDFRHVVDARLSILPDEGDSSSYRNIAGDDFEPLKPIHEQWISQSNLSIKRSDVQWRRLLKHPERNVSIYAHDRGYMLWNTKSNKDRTLEVMEWAWLDDQAFLDGLSLLRRMDDLHFDKATWIMSEPDAIYRHGITDPPIDVSIKPGMMSRVVHTEAFVESLGLELADFKVDDPFEVSRSYLSDGIADSDTGDVPILDPGQLIQYAVGALKDETGQAPKGLAGCAAGKKSFSVEFF